VTQLFPDELSGALFITVEPAALSIPVLRSIDTFIALGEHASDAIADFCWMIGVRAPVERLVPGAEEALLWRRSGDRRLRRIRLEKPRQPHLCHTRKYAQGEIGADHSFYFRGPRNRLNLRTQNLELFLQIAEGVDDETWEHHLRAGDYSAWFCDVIKDKSLAREAAEVERDGSLPAKESRPASRPRLRDAAPRLPKPADNSARV
jgi:hypothetical protein